MPRKTFSVLFLMTLCLVAAFPSVHGAPRRTLREDLQYQAGIVAVEFIYEKGSFLSCHAAMLPFGGKNRPRSTSWLT